MSDGYIKIHRKLADWEWFKDSHMVHLFLYLLMHANRFPKRWKGIDVDTGQLITGLHSLKSNTGISIQSLRTCLKKLKSTNEITIKATNQYSIITVCNYNMYQLLELPNKQTNKLANKPSTSNQQATNKQLTTTDKERKRERENTTSSPAGDGLRLAYSFDDFWLMYPRKVGKRTALASWKRQRLAKKAQLVIDALEIQIKTNDWQKDDGQFIPHPTTWLNQGRWEDTVMPAKVQMKKWQCTFCKTNDHKQDSASCPYN